MSNRRHILNADAFDQLFDALRDAGYTTVGPTLHDGAIVYDALTCAADLPVGWIDVQEAGRYAVQDTGSGRYFDYTVGPHTWKRFLRPPREPLFEAIRSGAGVAFHAAAAPEETYALMGVRACDLAALGVLDAVLTGQTYVDTRYATRRSRAFVVAVQCARAGNTCFCVSMNTGPRASAGFDLALTELKDAGRHVFVVEVGSPRGATIAAALGLRDSTEEDWAAARAVSAATAANMGRQLDTTGLVSLLQQEAENPLWNDIAQRCLACANCTMVCPTCFCTTVEIDSDLEQTRASHTQVSDSCFHASFTQMHGGPPVRDTTSARYRQWLTHKLSTWHDQFGHSGCVGCGRCVTWCPVGIDLTAEAARLRASHEERA